MAFDRNNPADLLALKTEVETDPVGVGYNPNGNENTLVDLLNSPAANPGLETGLDYITVKRLLDVIFNEAISSQDQFKIQLLFEATEGFYDDLSDYRASIGGLSANLQLAVDAITRKLSRSEILFSSVDANGTTERTILTIDDWHAARDS